MMTVKNNLDEIATAPENVAEMASDRLLKRSEVAGFLGTTSRKVGLYDSFGMIKSIRIGREYQYRLSWVYDFLEEWSGYDLRDEHKIRVAIKLKEREKNGNE